ncbi:hypothetical protein QBC44DRAFT_373013 [Cladorrhinum sp. PSN332]|nr:hypothetical protein QBC44DRAFT_373013 [Cladorrhinum sp. PSN332]
MGITAPEEEPPAAGLVHNLDSLAEEEVLNLISQLASLKHLQSPNPTRKYMTRVLREEIVKTMNPITPQQRRLHTLNAYDDDDDDDDDVHDGINVVDDSRMVDWASPTIKQRLKSIAHNHSYSQVKLPLRWMVSSGEGPPNLIRLLEIASGSETIGKQKMELTVTHGRLEEVGGEMDEEEEEKEEEEESDAEELAGLWKGIIWRAQFYERDVEAYQKRRDGVVKEIGGLRRREEELRGIVERMSPEWEGDCQALPE